LGSVTRAATLRKMRRECPAGFNFIPLQFFLLAFYKHFFP
jgi:hypothetical protein